MKTVKRVAFLIILLTLCFSGVLSLFRSHDLYSRNIISDVNFLTPILVSIFSLVGLLFSLKKFTFYFNTETIIYKILRTGDVIFSFLMTLFILYSFFEGVSTFLEKFINREISTFIFVIRIVFVLFILFMSIIYFIDNFKYHKEQKNREALLKGNLINEIGK